METTGNHVSVMETCVAGGAGTLGVMGWECLPEWSYVQGYVLG